MEVTKHQPGMFSWADLATPDHEGSKRFYTELLELGAADMPMGDGQSYTMLQKGGKNCCGVFEMPPEMRQATGGRPVWHSYFTVESADAAASRIAELGGTVIDGPFDVFTSGRTAAAMDPTGAAFAIWEPKDHIGAEVFGEPGALAWNELYTSDVEAAASFYGGLFGWSKRVHPRIEGVEYIEYHIDGQSAAGMMAIMPEWGEVPPHWSVYFAVADLDSSRERARSLGAKEMVPPIEVEGVGWVTPLQDPQGGYLSIIEITRGAA